MKGGIDIFEADSITTDESEEMTGSEACGAIEYPHDDELGGNLEEPASSPVIEEPYAAEVVYPSEPCAETECPPEPCAEPAWVDVSDQDSKTTSDTPTSETFSEVQPDGFLECEARKSGEQWFDGILSNSSGDRRKKKNSAQALETCCEMFEHHRVSGTWRWCVQCCNYVRSLAQEIEC